MPTCVDATCAQCISVPFQGLLVNPLLAFNWQAVEIEELISRGTRTIYHDKKRINKVRRSPDPATNEDKYCTCSRVTMYVKNA